LGVVALPDGIWWSESGRGPAVVVPRLNVDWTEIDLSDLTGRFRVIVVAPRGFGPSARPGSYHGPRFVEDIEHLLDRRGVERYATFGYSMNGAMAARLAVDNPRVTAVACGGFPLTADLSGMAERARGRHAAARDDRDAWAEMVAAHDPEAVVAFWEEIGRLPRAALAEVGCPVRAWWGEDDAAPAPDARRAPSALARSGLFVGASGDADVRRLRALGTGHDVVLDLLVLVERLVAVGLDGGEVDEHVLTAAVLSDEAEALVGVEPLDGSLSHVVLPCSAESTVLSGR
jgi:pimeloyl-ACP methyl ester carboxylesterase